MSTRLDQLDTHNRADSHLVELKTARMRPHAPIFAPGRAGVGRAGQLDQLDQLDQLSPALDQLDQPEYQNDQQQQRQRQQHHDQQ